ncbi:MAG TPA: hypothetical protein VGX76_07650, partial [Pirellulales bacterium]|nr:hypothetical protein [Pirellulales bacterium]
VAWLREFTRPIDVLYLDSLDAYSSGHDEHALAEIVAAYPKLHEKSLVLLDDTMWNRGWIGKGSKVIPWLMERGWRIMLAGYQALLERT